MRSPGRDAYRAIYLASPLKFCTQLHAFTRVLPRFHIDPWQKDPQGAEKHKWHTSQARKRGRWFYRHGPLAGVRLEGWPDPGLLGSGELVQVAMRAQAEGLQDTTFWLHVAERAYKLRDVMRVGDLAVLLDALVTANYRHTHLMKTLTREFADDAEKLTLVEVAVVANAYAHFSCVSEPMMTALARHVVQLLSGGDCGPYVRPGGDVASDPKSLAVLAKACASLRFSDGAMFAAVNAAAVEHVEGLQFDALSELWVAFAKLEQPFQANERFWSAVLSKVPGSRMASLCPALRASAVLKFRQPQLREALVAEILKGLQEAPVLPVPDPLGASLGLWEGGSEEASGPRQALPAFAPEHLPRSMLTALLPGTQGSEVAGAAADARDARPGFGSSGAPEDGETAVVEWADDALVAEEPAAAELPTSAKGRGRFYNAVSRRLSRASRPSFMPFNPTELFSRNRRGALIAEALEGLNILWEEGPQARAPAPAAASGAGGPGGGATGSSAAVEPLPPLAVPPEEAALLAAAAPVLRGAFPGLSAWQLVACAEALSYHAAHCELDGSVDRGVALDLVQEAVRKLSNFSTGELRRLHEACLQLGVTDPYLERAKQRRFPKALQLELQGGSAGSGQATAMSTGIE